MALFDGGSEVSATPDYDEDSEDTDEPAPVRELDFRNDRIVDWSILRQMGADYE